MRNKILLALIPLSIVCAISLRPDSTVEATGGRASTATTEKELEADIEATSAVAASKFNMPELTTTTIPPTTTTTAKPKPPPVQSPAVASGSVWDDLAQCESGGDWHINTGNGYYGGLQFSLASWRNVGGSGYPHEHSRETQIEMGKRLYAQGGWGHWPACSEKLGLR